MDFRNTSNPYFIEDLERIGYEFEKNNLVNKKILVTGSTGLIGSIIVKAAIRYNNTHNRKINIIALARNPEKVMLIYGSQTNNVSFIFQDICEVLPSNIQCDYIIHTANPTNSKQFISCPVEVIESIYKGTYNVLNFAKENNVKGVVYLSSMEVYGITEKNELLGEEELGYLDIHNVRSSYSEGKRLAECLCSSFAKEYAVPVRIARLAQTFGAGVFPWEQRVFAQFVRSVKESKDIVLHTSGQSFGNYVYTSDAITAILMLLKNGENGEAYSVVNEENTMRIYELAQRIIEVLGRKDINIVFDIPSDNKYGYAPDTKLRISSKKMESLGWKAKININDAIKRMEIDI